MEEKRARNLRILEMRKDRYTLAEIGKRYEISSARVWFIIENIRKQIRQEKKLMKKNNA